MSGQYTGRMYRMYALQAGMLMSVGSSFMSTKQKQRIVLLKNNKDLCVKGGFAPHQLEMRFGGTKPDVVIKVPEGHESTLSCYPPKFPP